MSAINRNILFGLSLVIYLLGGVSVLINYVVKMPYEGWLSENIPGWLSVLISLIVGAAFVITAIPKKSIILYNVVWIVLCAGVIISKSTFSKELFINILILLFSVLVFILTKQYYKRRNEKSST